MLPPVTLPSESTSTQATEPGRPVGPEAVQLTGHDAGLHRVVGFWGATAVMIGIIIGGGIFRVPLSISHELGSPALILLLWALGGVLCLFGGLTYAELATMFPESGGVYVFLREGFGRVVAFVFGWTYLLLTKPAGAAGVCILFAEYFNKLLVASLGTDVLRPVFGVNGSLVFITIITLFVVTLVNVLGVKLGARVAVVLTATKFAALGAIVALGLALGQDTGSLANFEAVAAPKPFLAALPAVLYGILWTYDGWSDVGAIAGEVKNPQKTLPRVYTTGILAIIGIYLAVNAVYLWLVPLVEMRTIQDTIAPTVLGRLIGPSAAIVVTCLIVVSTLGSTHGSVLTGGRVTFAQARDGLMFRFLGRVSPRFGTPAASLWAQCLLSCVAVVFFQTFDELAGAFVFTMWIFYALAGSAIFVLRVRRPGHPRPYRCWGYPVVPAIFVLASLAMTVLSISAAPGKTLPWLGLLLLGAPVYFWDKARRKKQGPGVCPFCGYSTTGLTSAQCPECGRDLTAPR
jgi:amino acid transporter